MHRFGTTVRRVLLRGCMAFWMLGAGMAAEAAVLKVGVGQGLVDADPHTCSLYSDVRILEQIYEGLTTLDPKTLSPKADLAESWSVSSDQLSWTFRLRPGVTFHDGHPLTSADVKASIERIMDPKTAATIRSDFDPIQAVTAPDGATVVVTLKHPFGILPTVLATPVWAAIVPAGASDLAGKPMGTGPFAFESLVPKTSVTLTKNTHYWDAGLPKVDGVSFVVVPDESARVAALVSHQVDVIDTVAMAQARQLQGTAGVKLLQFDSAWVDEFGMNNQRKPFDDVRVRRAVAMAINRDQVTMAATFGLGKAATTMVAMSPIAIDVEAIPFDVAKAKALLADAGLPNGFSFTFSPCGGTAFPQMERAGEVIAANLKAIGVDAKLTATEAGVWVDQVVNKRDYEAFVCGLVNGVDPDQKTYRYFTSKGAYNFSRYQPPASLDQQLEQGREIADLKQRSALYSKAWTQILADAPWVPLYRMPGLVGVSDAVDGLVVTPDTDLILSGVSLHP